MLEQWLSNPSNVGATALLIAAVAAFYKVLILPRQIHVEAIAQLNTAHTAHISDMVALHEASSKKYEAELQRERDENTRLREMVTRNVDVVDKSTDTLRLALTAFENAHAVRREVFEPKIDREQGQ